MFENIYQLISGLESWVGLILFLTLVAIIWYSWETRQLREWQKRNLQMSILDLAVKIKIAAQESLRAGHGQTAYVTHDFPETLRKIYEEGKLDLKDLYIVRQRNSIWKRFYNKVAMKIGSRIK